MATWHLPREDVDERIMYAEILWDLIGKTTDYKQPLGYFYARGFPIDYDLHEDVRVGAPCGIAVPVTAHHSLVTVTAVHFKRCDVCRKHNQHSRTCGVLGNGSVKFHWPEQGVLGLAEGVEDALSATHLFGVPCWATLGAGRLDKVWIPSEVHEVWLFGDNDAVGRAAVKRATSRFRREGRTVKVRIPIECKDWNEYLMRSKQNG